MQTITRRAFSVAAMAAPMIVSRDAAAQTSRMVIGTGVDPSFGPFYVAAEGGLFAKHGITVDLRTFASGSAAVPSLISRDIVASFNAPAAGIVNNAVSRDVLFVAHACTVTDIYDFVARAPITDLRGLRGKKIGMNRGGATEIFALHVLNTVGISRADITPVNLEAPEAVAALQRGDVDAVATFKPWTGRITAALPNTKQLAGAEWYKLHQHVLMHRGWLRDNRPTALRFLAAFLEACDLCNTKPQEASALIGRRLRMDPAAVMPLLTPNTFGLEWSDESMALLKREVDGQIQFGKLTSPYDYSQLVDVDLLREFDPKRVTLRGFPSS